MEVIMTTDSNKQEVTTENQLEKSFIPEKEGHTLSFLLDATYPLLKTLREKCPGTYKHSQALISMVESISLDLGLDLVEMKVCCAYHDVGKIYNSDFFSENILDDEDPHKELNPMESYNIIRAHVPDGVNLLLNDSNFPPSLIRIISQHHGNGLIEYFYNKALKISENTGTVVNKSDFRYHCSRPSSIEAAVLMICDHMEAKSRSLFQNGKLDPSTIIDQTLNNLLDDGLLDQVTMRLGDLKKIKKAMAKELEAMFQRRVDYEDINIEDA